MHVRILVFEKVDDRFPWTSGKPLAARTNSFYKGKRGVQINLLTLLCSYDEARMIILPESDDDLLRECEVETFRSSGPGGQHVNKTESAVRLTHLPSGVVVTSRQERSQHRNKALCLQRLRKKVAQLNYIPAKRVPTRIPRSAKNRTLEEKARRSQIKRLRSKPSSDE